VGEGNSRGGEREIERGRGGWRGVTAS